MADGLTNIRGVCPDCFKLKLCYQRGVGSNVRWVCDECWEEDNALSTKGETQGGKS